MVLLGFRAFASGLGLFDFKLLFKLLLLDLGLLDLLDLDLLGLELELLVLGLDKIFLRGFGASDSDG